MTGSSLKSKFGQKAPIIRMSRRSDVIASYSRDNSANNSDYSDYDDSRSARSQNSKSGTPKKAKNLDTIQKLKNGFVMVKGKAQPSNKYINDFMLPYTKKQGR